MKRLVLIDSHAIIHRAYHALPPLSSPKGEPTNAVYGFTTLFLRMARELKPDYVAAAFDLPGATFRHEKSAQYKAHRPPTPTDLASQFGGVEEMLAAFGVWVFKKSGFEADDIIATLTKKLSKKDLEIIIVTGDMDALQLVSKNVKVYAMRKGISDMVIYDEAAVRERYGVDASQMVDLKGLKGDASDNIAGVKGIGEKTAQELVQKFGSIKGIYAALKKKNHGIRAGVAAKLMAGKEDALLSRILAQMSYEVPLAVALDELAWKGGVISDRVRAACERFGFFNLLKRLSQDGGEEGEGAHKKVRSKKGAAQNESQGSLLSVPESKPQDILINSFDAWLFFIKTQKKFALALLPDSHLYIVGSEGKVAELGGGLFKDNAAKREIERMDFACVYDAKGIHRILIAHGIHRKSYPSDIMLAAYLTNLLGRDFSYLGIASRELGRMVSSHPDRELAHIFEIARGLEEKIEVQRLGRVYRDIELPLAPILAEMEARGILYDPMALVVLNKKVTKEIATLVEAIHKDAGEEFNINSSQQLSRILFEKLGIAPAGLRKTEKGGVVSTRESELEKLRARHPIIAKILDYRELAKLKSTYIDALPSLVNPSTKRIHSTFNQTGTSTGRLSSLNPNLQNIPIMSEYGREIRKAFVVDKGFVLIAADYSQIELRVAAHLADDVKMIAAFREGADIHRMTAAAINKISPAEVTPEMRRAAKTLNFGVLYGMGPVAFAEGTGFSRDEAKQFIEDYFREFAGIARYIVATKDRVRETGYAETLFGRRRSIPEINSTNWQLLREAERMAVNMPIQGTAADLVKLAMIAVDKWIRAEGLADEVRMLLQVHDELVFEVREDAVTRATGEIKRIMESVASLAVPLVVDVHTGRNWGEAK